MLDKLNDDCLLKMLEYVKDLKDQLALRRISQSLHENVQYHWQRIREIHLDSDAMEHFQRNPSEMHEFLRNASGSLQSVTLRPCNVELLRSWSGYTFPKVLSLDYAQVVCGTEGDEETLLLSQLFPHLTKLSLHSNTTGQHLWCWSQLQELHLNSCESLEESMFERVYSTLQLRKLTVLYYGYLVNLEDALLPASRMATLEELVIDDHHLLGECLSNLMELPRFRKLAFYTRDYHEYLLQSVAKLQPLKVKALLFNDSFWSSSTVFDSILCMRNVRRLTLQEDDIESQQLYNLCARLKNLEELHLIQMRELPTATQLWKIVNACPTLRILNLSNCKLNDMFLELSESCKDRVLDKRSAENPLTLHIHNTALEQDRLKTLAVLKHPHLEVSFKPIHLNAWSNRFVEIEFNPSVE